MKSRETIRKEMEKNKKLVDYYEDQEKVFSKMLKELDRKRRAHRLIERGAVLENYLRNPLILTNEQISKILSVAFSQDDVQRVLLDCIRESEKCAGKEVRDG